LTWDQPKKTLGAALDLAATLSASRIWIQIRNSSSGNRVQLGGQSRHLSNKHIIISGDTNGSVAYIDFNVSLKFANLTLDTGPYFFGWSGTSDILVSGPGAFYGSGYLNLTLFGSITFNTNNARFINGVTYDNRVNATIFMSHYIQSQLKLGSGITGVSLLEHTLPYSASQLSIKNSGGIIDAGIDTTGVNFVNNMWLAQNGNVGIGTVNPNSTLEVNGTATLKSSIELAQSLQSISSNTSMASQADGNIYRYTLGGNVALTLPTPPATTNGVMQITVMIHQDATGGRTVTFSPPSGSIAWSGGVTPTVCSSANHRTMYQFVKINGDSTWYAAQTWKECP
jgi:hypothetical protein